MRSVVRRAVATGVVCSVLLGGLVVAAAPPASADVGQFLWLDEQGTEAGVYGPNSQVVINLGAIAYACDFIYPTADVYVVSGVPGDGATLTDVSGGKNTVFGSWGGGIFDEPIAVTVPSGKLGAGTYSVVYDECQDGEFDAGLDAVFVDAITVELPPGELPPIDPAIAAIKSAAQGRADSYRDTGYALKALDKLAKQAAKAACKTGNLVACFWKGYYGIVGKRVMAVAQDAVADSRSHWQGIADDPPDPGFTEIATPVIDPLPADLVVEDEVDALMADVAMAADTDAALAEVLLHSVERYQGADAAGDAQAAHDQARAARDAAETAVALAPSQAATFDALADRLEADPARAEYDDLLADAEALRLQVRDAGFTEADEAYLRALGATDAEVASFASQLVADDDLAGLTTDDVIADLRGQADAIEASVPALIGFADDVDGLLAVLAIHEDVDAGGPVADAGGPYAGVAGATIGLTGSATGGTAPMAYAWDLDADGQFDDATGATPSLVVPATSGLVVVRVTDADGRSDTAVAPLTATVAGTPPTIALVDPLTTDAEVAVGTSKTFTVAATDPDGAPTVTWALDGAPVGSGASHTFGPATVAEFGSRRLTATVTEAQHTRRVTFDLYVVEPDGDGDGWRGALDCDDADPAVHPGTAELQGNGIDDDCDPATTDAIVNDPPTVRLLAPETLEDTPITITLAGSDPEDDPLTFEIVTPPAHGTLGPVVGNQVVYTPALDFTGSDTFTYRASDGELVSAPASVNLTVTPVPDAPIAAKVWTSTNEDTPVVVTLTGADPDGDPLTYQLVGLPAVGSASAPVGDTVTYTPAPDHNGVVTFSYRVSDGVQQSAPAQVAVRVLPVNDAPVALDQSATPPEDTALTAALTATDVDGDPLTYRIVTRPTRGTVTANGASFTYVPVADAFGTDTFTYRAFDGKALSAPATVTINVTPVDDPPSASDLAVVVPEDVPTTVRMTGTDPDSLLTYSIVAPPTHGTLSNLSGRRVLYTPSAEYSGPDAFTYRVTGSGVGSAPATVTIDVVARNDDPVAVDDAVATNDRQPVVVDVLANDTDVDGGPLSIVTVGLPTSGSASVVPGGIRFVPANGFTGTANVPYVVSDGAGGSATATLTVLVTDGPVDSRTWTAEPQFSVGERFNVEQHGPNGLRINDRAQAFNRIWVAVSTKGTIVKLDTNTGAILAEYWTSPMGQPKNPSRTTVDLNGSVWATNRDGNSVVHIGLVENGECEDRNGNGQIDTSTGFGDVRSWDGAGGVDTDGGVDTAADECILHYTRVSSSGTRHVAVTPTNDIWVSGTGSRAFDLIDGDTGQVLRTEGPVGIGGYGGLIDPNGVIWSSTSGSLLWWDTSKPLSGPAGEGWKNLPSNAYGLCIDPAGNVWGTTLGEGVVRKHAPDGTVLGTFPQGDPYAQGCAVDANGDVWIAHSLYRGTVGHLKNDGTFVGNVVVGSGPTGIAVDAAGKVWSTDFNAGTVSRIDPALGPVGADGETAVGAVDFTSPNLGGNPYNYSDMTGSTLTGRPQSGTWTATFDAGDVGADWAALSWTARNACAADAVTVTAASSEDPASFGPGAPATNGEPLAVADGRYLKVVVTLRRCADGASPVLDDLTAWTESPEPPVATDNEATTEEDVPVAMAFEADTVPAGGAVTYTVLKPPSFGAIGPVSPAGTFTYTPAPDYHGYDSIGFRVSDGSLSSSVAYAVVEVTPVNDAPVAADVGASTVHATPVGLTLVGTDVDGDTLTYELVDGPSHGDVVGVAGGAPTYTPDTGFLGDDTFTYRVDDGTVTSAVATVTVTVAAAVPGAPQSVSAIGGDGNARVRWETPLSDGGAPILEYEVTSDPGGVTVLVGPDVRVALVEGLANDTEYRFAVRARNVAGWGPVGTSNLARTRVPCAVPPFSDVPTTHPFCPEITWMKVHGVGTGYPNGTYRPSTDVSRAVMAAFLYRLSGSPDGDDPTCAADPFPDVDRDNPFCGEILWAIEAGVTKGYDDGTFRPTASISRAGMSAFLYRFSGSPRGDGPTCTTDKFPDVTTSHPFCGEIAWMVDNGLVGGDAEGRFNPGGATTRGSMAALLVRYNILTGIITGD